MSNQDLNNLLTDLMVKNLKGDIPIFGEITIKIADKKPQSCEIKKFSSKVEKIMVK